MARFCGSRWTARLHSAETTHIRLGKQSIVSFQLLTAIEALPSGRHIAVLVQLISGMPFEYTQGIYHRYRAVRGWCRPR